MTGTQRRIAALLRDMRIVLAIIAAALAGCSDRQPSATRITLGDAAYRVPDSHIVSVTREPHRFVRIKPPEENFELIYDSRTSGRADADGWPIIFSLNDKTAPTIERHEVKGSKVVCRRAVNPRGGCGLVVSNDGAQWAVLFPNARFAETPAIMDRAEAALRAYED